MKKLILFLFLYGIAGLSGLAAQPADALERADSLFEQKKYGQAYELYAQIDEEGYTSPAMLLRMAFIKEGLKEYSRALYFLNRYYLLTYDRQVLDKMAEVAEAQGLQGYALNDFRLFRNAFARYYDVVIACLAGLALLFIVLAGWKRQRSRKRPVGLVIASWVAFAIVLILINTDGARSDYAIVEGTSVYLMEGPSAGAPLAELIGPGHKVSIEEAGDIWTKIAWGEREVWVRSRQLLPLASR
ncbi:hypothetical protein AB9P05_04795 [Roseivirga sp. BDSF3-8]|uniref:hypothetical protein n=1 Tax=Roseivirga sp. BDSF3-8 TaxID=3241598 RepID=UPI003532567F